MTYEELVKLAKPFLDAWAMGCEIQYMNRHLFDPVVGPLNQEWHDVLFDHKGGAYFDFDQYKYRVKPARQPSSIRPILQLGQAEYLAPVPRDLSGPGRHWWRVASMTRAEVDRLRIDSGEVLNGSPQHLDLDQLKHALSMSAHLFEGELTDWRLKAVQKALRQVNTALAAQRELGD